MKTQVSLLLRVQSDETEFWREVWTWTWIVIPTSTWSCGSGTRFWPARPSSSGSWPGRPARRSPGTSAGGSASPARRSELWRRTCGAFSAWEASGSGTGVLSAGWRRTAPEPLRKQGEREREREAGRWRETHRWEERRWDFIATAPNRLIHSPLCMEIRGHTSQISALFDNNSLFRLCKPGVRNVGWNS